MEELKFTDDNEQEFGLLANTLAETTLWSPINAERNHKGPATFYKSINPEKDGRPPDYILKIETAPGEIEWLTFPDWFFLREYARLALEDYVRNPEITSLWNPLRDCIRDGRSHDYKLNQVFTQLMEHRQILQGQRKPTPEPKQEPDPTPVVAIPQKEKPLNLAFPWV